MQKALSLSDNTILRKLVSLPVLVNAALFQVTWFACALGAARNMLWPALAACLVLAIYQLQASRRHPSDVYLVITAIGLGLIIDSAWVQFELISYAAPSPISGLAPIWIIILWVGFALTINHSLAWLKAHPLLPAAAGLICAPLSYVAGIKLNALSFLDDNLLICCVLGIAWAIALTLLVRISELKTQ